MNERKKHVIDPRALGLWEGCDHAWYTAAGRCAVCGKGKSDHTAAGAAGAVAQRAAADALRPAVRAAKALPPLAGGLRVTFTRGYRSTPLDRDNLVGGFKLLRDEIARVLGRDDAEREGIEWCYEQAQGAVCKVEIEEVEE